MKKVILIVALCGFMMLLLIITSISNAQQSMVAVFMGNQQSEENDDDKGICSYIADASKVFDENTESLRAEFENKIAKYFVPLAMAMYQINNDLTVDEISDVINAFDGEKSINENLQVYKYGNGYKEYLMAINEEHSLSTSKKYFKTKYEYADTETRAFVYYLDVLSVLNESCEVYATTDEFVAPEDKPIRITQDFGGGNVAGGLHLGVDMTNGYGANVYAVTDAIVDDAQQTCASNGGYLGNQCNYGQGNFIRLKKELDDRTIYIVYMHLATINIKKGDEVSAGQLIAYQGHSGNSTGSHLHLEFRKIPNVTSNIENCLNPHEYIDFY